jgi:hypothetical protein
MFVSWFCTEQTKETVKDSKDKGISQGKKRKEKKREEKELRQILGARPIGKRGRGRPRKTWEDMIEELGRQKGKTVREMDKLAKDRIMFGRWTEDPDTGR